MKTKTTLIAAVILMSLIASISSIAFDVMPAQASSTNIVANGSFEQPVVLHPAKWNIYDSNEIDGWYMVWIPGPNMYDGHPRPSDAYIELQRQVRGWEAADGYQWAELDSDWDGPDGTINYEPGSVRICQDLTTIRHGVYKLRFAFSPRPGVEDNRLEVKWDGEIVDILDADGQGLSQTDWTYYEYIVAATSETTRLEFADLSSPDALGTFLDDVSVELKCEPFVTDLVIRFCRCRYLKVGTVTVWNDGTYLYVKYSLSKCYLVLFKTHLAVATSLEGIPQTKTGNPIPGQFPYQTTHCPPVKEYTYTIELGEWEVGTELYIAAHAEVWFGKLKCCGLTAWGYGQQFPGCSWGMYFQYTICDP